MGNPTKLIPENQLILDAPLLKVPLELIRRNFKTAQKNIDRETKTLSSSITEAAQKAQAGTASPEETAASIDTMLNKMKALKRKVYPFFSSLNSCADAYQLVDLQAEEELWLHRSKVRVAHISELFECHTLEDIKFEKWSDQRLDRLLVEYMLRKGLSESSIRLGQMKHIEVWHPWCMEANSFRISSTSKSSRNVGKLSRHSWEKV